MAELHDEGLLDTCVLIDMARAKASIGLPQHSIICAISLAELNYGIATATDPVEVVRRAERYARLSSWVTPLPFDELAAVRYGELAAMVLRAGRQPRPRRLDLMIAAIAVANELPLYTLNADDFRDLTPTLTLVG